MHTHAYTDSHTHRYSSTQDVHAYKCKKYMNYILTLYMYKIFLVFEKYIPHTIILRWCLNYPEVTLTENEMNQIS